jgi:hypothetical protein
MLFICVDNELAEAMHKYFESMLTYKVSSIISTLIALQVKLLSGAAKMSPDEMDRELDRLENVRRLLEKRGI